MSEFVVDLRGLLRGLHEYDVEYVLLGAVAMVFYGYVRNTDDFDVVVNPESENLDRVTEWLKSIDAMLKLNPSRPFGARERWGLQKGSNATVLTTLGQVDVVQQLPGMPEWPQLIEDAELYEIDGMRVQVINRRTLIELKRRRGSNLDLADIAAIELLPEL
jgi:predicted nucleotidyltransferase